MSYEIRYGGAEYPERERSASLWSWGLLAICGAFAVGLLWPDTSEAVRRILFPWVDGETAVFFETMLEQIRQGTGVGEALLTFCREVLSHGV